MSVRVRLSDKCFFVIDGEIEDFKRTFQRALKLNDLIIVKNREGKKRGLNPRQVVYFEQTAEDWARS